MSMHVITLHRLVGVFQSIKRIWLTRIQSLTSAGTFFFPTQVQTCSGSTHPCRHWMAATILTALKLMEHGTDHPPLAADEVNTARSFYLHFTHIPSIHDT